MRWFGVLALASVAGYGVARGVAPWTEHMPAFLLVYSVLFLAYAAACVRVWGGRAPDPRLVWGGAVVFRGILLTAPLCLSDDLYRYLWDGRVFLSGINPYRYAPGDPALASLRDGIGPFINHPDLVTIYPPLLQLVFAGVAQVAPTELGMRAAMVLFDLAAGWFLARSLRASGRPAGAVLIYLWNPLVVVEFAGSGHADAVGVFLLAAALDAWVRGWALRAGLALTLAGLVKFLPWCAVPLLARRLGWRWLLLPAVVAAFYAPFQLGGVDALGSLGVFAAKWRANDYLFARLLADGPVTEGSLAAARRAAAVLIGMVWLSLVVRRRPWPEVYLATVGTALLLSPVVHPWYLTWLVPVLVLTPRLGWWLWTGLVPLAYLPLPAFRAGGAWVESAAVKRLEYGPVLAALVADAVRRRWRRHGAR